MTLSQAQGPAGWKVVKEKTSACQISIPGDWTVSKDLPGNASAPGNGGDVQVLSQAGKTVKPMSDMAQKALSVDKMIQNTPQVVFFSNPPTKSDNPITPYHATVPGKGGTCVALISARKTVSEDTVKKMVSTLSAAQ